ncbi:hypothetical protein [Marinospirillum sp.]|uniref:hypothetical protein n=1 Tax=Marinospirillum sp. TaxID=2183934 RepID=UPI00384FB283
MYKSIRPPHTACIRIKSNLKQQEAAQPIVIEADQKSRRITDLVKVINYEVSEAENLGRDLSAVHPSYLVEGAEGRKPLRNHQAILDDLLAQDDTRNLQAAKALQTLFVYKR